MTYETGPVQFKGQGLIWLKRAVLLSASYSAIIVACNAGLSDRAVAQGIAPGFNTDRFPASPGTGPGTAISADGRTLDGIADAVKLPFQVNYFGKTYSDVFVNNHGNLTFESASSQFIPTGLGSSYSGQPIIAPFFSDTDTRNPASGVTSFGSGTYQGRTAFGATWQNVGYYNEKADKTNSFQAILANRSDTGSGNFDIYFNYGSMTWECSDVGGQGGSGGQCTQGSSPPAAGFSAGTGKAGTYFELAGSLVPGAFIDGGPNALSTSSNHGVPGQFLFPVRNGSVLIANVCSPGDSASATTLANCGPGKSYDQGIFYQPTGTFTLNVLADTTISAASGQSSILVMPVAASGAGSQNPVTVTIASSARIRSDTGAGVEIDGATEAGVATVNNAGSIMAGSAGVLAVTRSFTMTNEATGSIAAPFGILAQTGGLATVANAGTIRAGVGVALSAAAATVSNSGALTFGQAGIAAVGGTIAIANTGTLAYDPSIPNALTPGVLNRLPEVGKGIAAAIESVLRSGSNQNLDQLPVVGIGAIAQRSLTIDNAGTITGGAAGIAVVSGAPATSGAPGSVGRITLINSGTVTAASGTAIAAATFGGPLSITNEVGGRILGAIDTSLSAGAARIDNRGDLVGRAKLSAGSTFTNSGTFAATGASTFGGGTIGNSGTIVLAPDATLGSLSSFTNAGVVQGPIGGSARIVTSTFTNAGTISLQNGAAGDTLTIAGNYVGRNGVVNLDVSSQAGTADRLVITGNAGGTTGLNLLNVTPGAAFTVSPVLVQVRGQQEANAFTLASARNFGAIDVSLASGRVTEGGNTLSLVSVPSALGQSGPTAVIAARTIAFQGGTAVLDRMTQLRSDVQRAAASAPTAIPQALQYAGLTQYAALVSKDPIVPNLVQPAPAPASNVKPAVWARAFGDLERRTGFSSGSFNGVNVGRDLGYSQSTGGVLVGADLVMSGITAPDDGLILGVLGGYTTAAVRLNQNAGRQDYEGGTVGTYATYIKGGFFADAMFKVDLLDLDITGANLRQNTGLTNYDVLGNIGYRFDLPNALYIEPTAGLEYVSTVFDRKTGGTAGTVALQDGDAFRGRIGARLGTEFVQDDIRVEPSITGLVYDVFSESGTTASFGSGTRLTGLTNVGKVRGEIQASMNFFNLKTGVSGFLRADYRIGDDLVGGGGKAGIRYQW